MNDTRYIYEATAENFQSLVLENSRKGPVLVNYWAPWAGPCLKLWPVLAKLAEEYCGKFLLVNLNTDQQRQLARDQGVNSLPTLKVYRHQKVVDEVHGAESEARLRQLIDRYVGRPSDVQLGTAVRLHQEGQLAAAYALLDEAGAAEPANARIAITHAKLLMRDGDTIEAAERLRALPSTAREDPSVAILMAHLGFINEARQAPDATELEQALERDPADLGVRYQLSALRLLSDDYEGAMDELLEIVRRDRFFRDEVGRKGLMAIFALLGENDARVRRYRAALLGTIH